MNGEDLFRGLNYVSAKFIDEAETVTQLKADRISKKKLVILSLAATMLLATLTGAAIFTRWSRSAQASFNPSQDIKEQAEQSGLSVMLEETKGTENPNEILSVTDQGITITAVQSIVDNYQARITFRIEGFDLPEDKLPALWPEVLIDGDAHFGGLQSGWFYDGLTTSAEGKTVYASNGQPVQSDEDGCLILDFVADDGSLEYTHFISFEQTDGRYMGKEITFAFDSIDFQSSEKAGMPIPQVEGKWELRWTLTGAESNIKIAPNVQIGNSDVILLDAEIGQITLRTRYQLKDYWEGWDELVELPQAICGVRMKDGTEHLCYPGSGGFEDEEKMIYYIDSRMSNSILDISQVESLMFHKDWKYDTDGKITGRMYYYIPIF